jgi:hypothetical protein
MRTGARVALPVAVVAVVAACSGLGGLPTDYEYEEEVFLSLDGSATVYVNGSVAALKALRGAPFDPAARVDRDEVRRYFTSPVTRVTRVSRPTHRNGRWYVHVRLETDDVRRLSGAPPFAWSSYWLAEEPPLVVYRQTIGPPAPGAAVRSGLEAGALTAFRLHAPSRVEYHNAGAGNLKRGNILVWEQPFADRLRGAPLTLEVRMEPRSILQTTLWLFAGMLATAGACFATVVWWVRRCGLRSAVRA